MDILKKDAKTGEVLEKFCFVDGSIVRYEFDNPEEISDGYHTFDELYEHRTVLFIVLCKRLSYVVDPLEQPAKIWRSKKHSDGKLIFGGKWFVLGINKEKGEQITYHLPIEKWEECIFAETLDKAPEYDGHTSDDVLKRLKNF